MRIIENKSSVLTISDLKFLAFEVRVGILGGIDALSYVNSLSEENREKCGELEQQVINKEWSKAKNELDILLNWLENDSAVLNIEKDIEPNEVYTPKEIRQLIKKLIVEIEKRENWDKKQK